MGVGKAGQTALVDAYQRLKLTLKCKFGDDSEVVEAVEKVEQKPNSQGRKGMLQEELEEARVDQDPEVRRLAQELLKQLQVQPGGKKHVQHAQGIMTKRRHFLP